MTQTDIKQILKDTQKALAYEIRRNELLQKDIDAIDDKYIAEIEEINAAHCEELFDLLQMMFGLKAENALLKQQIRAGRLQ